MPQDFSDPLMDLLVHPDCPPQVTVTANRPRADTRHAVVRLRCQPKEGRRDRFVASPAGYEHTNQKPAVPWWADHLKIDGYRSEWTVWANVPRVFNPVVLLDGQPIAHGWGEAFLSLPAGTYRVEVQLGHSNNPRLVTVGAGKTIDVSFTGSRLRSMREIFGRVRDSYLSSGLSVGRRPVLAALFRARMRIMVIAALVIALPLAVVAGVVAGSMIIFWVVVGALWLLPILVHLGWYCWQNRLDRQPATAVSGTDPYRPHLLDPRGDPDYRAGEFDAVIVVDLNYYQLPVPQLTTAREHASNSRLPWVSAPRVWIDGVETFGCWGRVAYSVPPGRHEVRIVAPLPDKSLRSGDSRFAMCGDFEERHHCDLSPGSSHLIASRARILNETDPSGTHLAVYGADWQSHRERPAGRR